jgi:hypothetical protein
MSAIHYTYTFARRSNGATDVGVVIVREGKNAKRRFLAGSMTSVIARAKP